MPGTLADDSAGPASGAPAIVEGDAAVLVVGAGISGLCVAYWLKRLGVNVVVVEKGAGPGGTIRTEIENGWLVEAGPTSALENTPLFHELFEDLGIVDRRCYANDRASRRYILRAGELREVPMSPVSFLTSRLWSARGKLRVLKEPFVGRAHEEESVAGFVRRRVGGEFLDYAINPFVAGVYAGDPEKLSIQAAFPKMYALEAKHGGLFRGMIALRKERKAGGPAGQWKSRLFSFTDGMQTLPRSIASALGNSLLLNAGVERIVPMRAGRRPSYVVSLNRNGRSESVVASAVVLAVPAHAAGGIVRAIDPDMAATFDSIFYPPVASVFLGFRTAQVARDLDGFGYLVPEREHRKILGTIWSSALFPGRAPDGCAAFTSFVGGARQPELFSLSDEAMREIVVEELHSVMRITGDPIYLRINRWERAIPQYTLGYGRVLKSIDRFEQNYRGAFVCSNFRGGISLGDCVRNARSMADTVARYLSE